MVPPPGATGEEQILFPAVAIRMTRSRGLVSPAFVDTPSIYETSTTLAPRGWKRVRTHWHWTLSPSCSKPRFPPTN